MTRLFRIIFAALSLCLLLASAQPAAACGSPEDFARMEVYDFLNELGLKERVERVDIRLDKNDKSGLAAVTFKQASKPLTLRIAYTDRGWVVMT
ncbi:MAG: hypothetical protein H6718_20585 [Polyangiaceae bacterium]|nr:hypothetical protein [Myxococcales bacterium]MCB9587813.1 hypothetical protein [Polyangiaceae bacterium]MCB9608762.1 hypothetical protein [Polyangiaceae bacterium]